jgi:hypothetical protein
VGQHLARAEYGRQLALTNTLKPPPPVDYEKWAVDNVSFSDRESQFPGPYNPNRFRPFTEIYKALSPAEPCRIRSTPPMRQESAAFGAKPNGSTARSSSSSAGLIRKERGLSYEGNWVTV